MSKFYISFGSDHQHKIGGITTGGHVLLEIEAEDMGAARDFAFANFGRDFCTTYYSDKGFRGYVQIYRLEAVLLHNE